MAAGHSGAGASRPAAGSFVQSLPSRLRFSACMSGGGPLRTRAPPDPGPPMDPRLAPQIEDLVFHDQRLVVRAFHVLVDPDPLAVLARLAVGLPAPEAPHQPPV